MPHHLLRVYKSMQLIAKEMNQVYALVLPGGKILLALFAVFCTVGAIRLDGITAMALSSIGVSTTIFLGIMVNTLAEFHSRSTQVLRFIQQTITEQNPQYGRNSGRQGYVRKSVRALTAIRIYMGSAYFIDKGVVLLLFRAVTESTVNFLLVTK